MSMPIVCIPPVLNGLLATYSTLYTKPQFGHLRRLVTGLIVSQNKTLQEINDSFGERDQSNLNRFVNESPWDSEELNQLRLKQVQEHLELKEKGILVIDESLAHKTGKHMEFAGRHRSGVTKQIEWGHLLVNAFYTDNADNGFPVKTDVYVREEDCAKYTDVTFKTKREMAIGHLDYALAAGLPVGVVVVDAGYEGKEFTRAIKERGCDFIIGVRVTTGISIAGAKRKPIKDYLATLTDEDFNLCIVEDKVYFYHLREVSMRGIGMITLIVCYGDGDEEEVKCYITNLKEDDETIIKTLAKRWRIECFHRDAKQHLGLEAYQVRKGGGMQIVALAVLTAYTLVNLAARILETPGRKLETVGEVCRYFQLVAYKGVRWVRDKLKTPQGALQTLNRHVFVKNAKV